MTLILPLDESLHQTRRGTLLYQRRPAMTGHRTLGHRSALVAEMVTTLAGRLRS